jgi:hypothetical protein
MKSVTHLLDEYKDLERTAGRCYNLKVLHRPSSSAALLCGIPSSESARCTARLGRQVAMWTAL